MAQFESIIKSFNAREIENKIELSWLIEKGKSCNDIFIYRAIDSINFQRINTIYGVCGSEFDEQEFRFIDSFPAKNQTNYYKLEFGGIGFSHILAINHLDLDSNNILIRFSESEKKYLIYLQNENGQKLTLKLYDIRANELYTHSTYSNFFELDTEYLINGSYIIQIFDTNLNFYSQGKLSIVN